MHHRRYQFRFTFNFDTLLVSNIKPCPILTSLRHPTASAPSCANGTIRACPHPKLRATDVPVDSEPNEMSAVVDDRTDGTEIGH